MFWLYVITPGHKNHECKCIQGVEEWCILQIDLYTFKFDLFRGNYFWIQSWQKWIFQYIEMVNYWKCKSDDYELKKNQHYYCYYLLYSRNNQLFNDFYEHHELSILFYLCLTLVHQKIVKLWPANFGNWKHLNFFIRIQTISKIFFIVFLCLIHEKKIKWKKNESTHK